MSEKYAKRIAESQSVLYKIIKNTLGNKCETCGKTQKLYIHHNSYDPGLTIKDLQLLCASCHLKIHGKITVEENKNKFFDHLKSLKKEKIPFGSLQIKYYAQTIKKYIGILKEEGKIDFVEGKTISAGTIIMKSKDDMI